MAKQSTEQPVRPRATSGSLKAAIEQARKDLDAIGTSRLRRDGQWRHGPLIWQTLLEVSLDTASTGLAPKISKHQLTEAVKRRSGLDLEVDAKVWKRFQSFYQQEVMGRLRLAAAASELPALAAERSTENGRFGGAPAKTQAVYWLCIDTDQKSDEQTTSNVHAKAQGPRLTRVAAAKVSTFCEQGSTAKEGPNSHREKAQALLQEPGTFAESKASDQATGNLGIGVNHSPATNDSHGIWRSPPRPYAACPSSIPLAVVFALALLLLPVLAGVTTEFLQPVQALADSISALAEVLKSSIVVWI